MIDLSGKVALIPGGSGGIGSAVSHVLAECGADIIIGYHSNKQRAEDIVEEALQLGRQARADEIDATSLSDVQRWVASVLNEYGKIDIMANCAGWHGQFQLLKDQPSEEWRHIIDMVLLSTPFVLGL
jgi:NAD(P)-dependent dehydrogenase (short-subunit alcohol dehydrogenase family)